jgi:RNA polymerase sigma-70 factor (ECF subfamily)
VQKGSNTQDAAASIVQRLAAGEVEAVAELYDQHAALVYGLARRILRNDADAEDVVQEVFAQAWRSAARYDRSRGTVIAWLLVMTRTRSLDRLRSRQARPDGDPSELPDTLASAMAAPPDQLIASEAAATVRDALGALPAPQRRALELAYFEGLTQQEIAARLAEPLGTVKTRMRTALETLRARLRR